MDVFLNIVNLFGAFLQLTSRSHIIFLILVAITNFERHASPLFKYLEFQGKVQTAWEVYYVCMILSIISNPPSLGSDTN